MTRSVTVNAPAKINLTLDVFLPRNDGFHDLDSLVVKVAPFDTLTFTVTEETTTSELRMTCSDPRLATDESNLVMRATKALLAEYGQKVSVSIHLEKRLPMQAGLGGGSSDAAATLQALGDLWEIPQATRRRIGATIGSDIPLFLTTGTIRMQGRGERVSAFPDMPELHGVLVQPAVGVPTGPAYRLLDDIPGRRPGQSTERMLVALQQGASVKEIATLMHNDFESAVRPAFPEIDELYATLLEAGALRVLLCGSGSALFALTESEASAIALSDSLQGRYPFVERIQVWHG